MRLAELRLRRGVVAAWQDWALLRQAPGAAAAAASAGSVKGASRRDRLARGVFFCLLVGAEG